MRRCQPRRENTRPSRWPGASSTWRGCSLAGQEAIHVAEHPERIVPHDEVPRGVVQLDAHPAQTGELIAQRRHVMRMVGVLGVALPGCKDERRRLDLRKVGTKVGLVHLTKRVADGLRV